METPPPILQYNTIEISQSSRQASDQTTSQKTCDKFNIKWERPDKADGGWEKMYHEAAVSH
jgi:hypothetical protein